LGLLEDILAESERVESEVVESEVVETPSSFLATESIIGSDPASHISFDASSASCVFSKLTVCRIDDQVKFIQMDFTGGCSSLRKGIEADGVCSYHIVGNENPRTLYIGKEVDGT
jgi:hypothetical protein